MSNKYEIQHGAQRLGPYTSANIKEMASAGTLNPDDLIRQVGTDKWVIASKVKSLQFSEQADTISEGMVQASVSTSSHISHTDVVEPKFKKPRSGLKKKIFLILGLVLLIASLLSILVPTLNRAREGVGQTRKDDFSQIKSKTNPSINNYPSVPVQDSQIETLGIWKDNWGEWSIRRKDGRYILRAVFNQDGSSLEYQLKKRSTPHGDRFDPIEKTEGIVEYFILNSKGNLETWDQDGFVDEIGTDGVVRERTYQDENNASTNLGKWQVLQPQINEFTDETSYAIALPANNEIRSSFINEKPVLYIVLTEKYATIYVNFFMVQDKEYLWCRFDDSEPQLFTAERSKDYHTLLLDPRYKTKFVTHLKSSEKLRILATPYGEKSQTANFDLSGFLEAIHELQVMSGKDFFDCLPPK